VISLQNYINGTFVSAVSGQTIDNVDPSTGKVYSLIPRSEQADVDAAGLGPGEGVAYL
jgi:acyl-CoA reductase-like NAD-dependent aldehyde dehydrogenase